MMEPTHEPLSAAELGEMRRELLRTLNDVDPASAHPDRRETACRRIQRLSRDGVIPDSVADLMHVVRKCRNRAEYQDRVPDGMEAQAIRSAWAAIDYWRSQNQRTCPKNGAQGRPATEVTA